MTYGPTHPTSVRCIFNSLLFHSDPCSLGQIAGLFPRTLLWCGTVSWLAKPEVVGELLPADPCLSLLQYYCLRPRWKLNLLSKHHHHDLHGDFYLWEDSSCVCFIELRKVRENVQPSGKTNTRPTPFQNSFSSLKKYSKLRCPNNIYDPCVCVSPPSPLSLSNKLRPSSGQSGKKHRVRLLPQDNFLITAHTKL